MFEDTTIDLENVTGAEFYDAETTLTNSFQSFLTPRTLAETKTTLDHTVCLEDLPSPPKIPPSRSDSVKSRVDQFNKWTHLSRTLAKDSFVDDTTHSPLRRSALRDVTQDNTSPTGCKRKLKKQVSFVEHNESNIYLYTPAPCTPQQCAASNMVHSPPPYEQIAGLIANRKRAGRGSFNRSDQFIDATSSFSHNIR
ncbi:uncharacterized protein LOC134812883 [Bolinopsis microptera]|uniref:uncharacterized protein LOC134812883 n=1 Tax=Bolinopsis microptera TaxID=2820187 RepID=UPI00307A9E08